MGERTLKIKIKRLANRSDRGVQRLTEIENTITDLANEHVLVLADIFKAAPRTPIGEIAFRRDGVAQNQSVNVAPQEAI